MSHEREFFIADSAVRALDKTRKIIIMIKEINCDTARFLEAGDVKTDARPQGLSLGRIQTERLFRPRQRRQKNQRKLGGIRSSRRIKRLRRGNLGGLYRAKSEKRGRSGLRVSRARKIYRRGAEFIRSGTPRRRIREARGRG